MICQKNNNVAIVICGHGSRQEEYKKDFLKFKRRIKISLVSVDVFHCFLEINKPSISSCLKNVAKNYKKVLFFPLLLFSGKHHEIDIKKKISSFNKEFSENIQLLEKLSLIREILPIINSSIRKKIKKDHQNILITSCSPSIKVNVIKELKIYTNKLSKNIFNKHMFHSVGEEKMIIEKLNKQNSESNQIILHPVFLFNGYLYQKNKSVFQRFLKNKITVLKPIINKRKIIELIRDKLISEIQS